MVQVMTDVRQPKDRKTLGSKLASTFLVFTVPLLLLAVIGLIGDGAFGIGTVEIALLCALWAVGLTLVWRPRRG